MRIVKISLVHLSAALIDSSRRFFGAIVYGAEPFIPWHVGCAVVAFKITVMQLVK